MTSSKLMYEITCSQFSGTRMSQFVLVVLSSNHLWRKMSLHWDPVHIGPTNWKEFESHTLQQHLLSLLLNKVCHGLYMYLFSLSSLKPGCIMSDIPVYQDKTKTCWCRLRYCLHVPFKYHWLFSSLWLEYLTHTSHALLDWFKHHNVLANLRFEVDGKTHVFGSQKLACSGW